MKGSKQREKITLKMRSLLSETRASPPLKWSVHVRSRSVTKTPIHLTVGKIGNLTTGGLAIYLKSKGERERERERVLISESDKEIVTSTTGKMQFMSTFVNVNCDVSLG